MRSEWQKGKLGDFIELKRGYDLPKKHRSDGNVPIVSSSGLNGTHSDFKVAAPGVVTGRYGTIGQVFFVTEDFWPLNTTLYVRDFKGNDPLYISYFLRTFDFNKYSDKAAVPGVNRNHLHEADVALPELDEQQDIAQTLGAIDDKIANNRALAADLEAMARAIFKSWFVDFDPVKAKMEGRAPTGMDADTAALFSDALVESELGLIPQGWGVSTIVDLCEIVGGATPPTKTSDFWDGGQHYWATPKDLSALLVPVLWSTARQITDAGLAKISSGLLPKGTVLLSSRAPIGYLAITQIPTAINQGFIAMKPREGVSSAFLMLWAKTFMDTIIGNANGSTFQEISKKSFRPIRLTRPPAKVLRAFCNVTNPLFEAIANLDAECSGLAELRDTLLPRLISGRLRVPEAEVAIAEAAA
ncbi:MAG: restriction endonuclease subunit S [Chromatiaceae bacterium]|nr:restriction endonuclease subunit S [Chromatiaceae bacterium]MCF7993719.1 restriction endonuclease subunit S [Chromatiaceae bacterium]MCF8004039.1 restriction endonuclease subunit S [Chromatiaceae bacterium]MCF8014938.1 restriction endonuclease subunit S [Chromatiaceae bacterium]